MGGWPSCEAEEHHIERAVEHLHLCMTVVSLAPPTLQAWRSCSAALVTVLLASVFVLGGTNTWKILKVTHPDSVMTIVAHRPTTQVLNLSLSMVSGVEALHCHRFTGNV